MDQFAPKSESYVPAPQFRFSPKQAEIDFAQLVAAGGDLVESLPLSGLITFDEAATRTRSSLYGTAARLLSTPAIQERLDFYRQLHQASMAITAERIQQELAATAFSDPADLFDEHGQPRHNIRDVPRHARAALKKWGFDKDGLLKFELQDKGKAIKMLGDVAGMFNEAYEAQAPTITVGLGSTSEPLPAPSAYDLIDVTPAAPAALPEATTGPMPDFLL